MTDITKELVAFQKFALSRIDQRDSETTLDALFDEWRCLNPSDQQFVDSTRAIAASLRDLDSGKAGRDAGDVLDDLKERFIR